MSRAIVLIGVSRTARDDFPVLEGVEDAITKMEAWARYQEIPHIEKITDVGESAVEKVTVALINSTIERLAADAGSLQQLIIYFSGHGIVNSLNEYLLLSLAPQNANEAINVTGSIALAQTWKVPHVVFFSDACRTVAPHVQVDRITGSLIIPNEIVPGPEKVVDIFYATRLGTPALEVTNGKKYVAVYTDVLQKGLSGRIPKLIQNGYIRPRPLKKWLAQAVPEHLLDMNLNILVSQSPDARLSSGDDEWLSRFDLPVDAAGPNIPGPPSPSPAPLPSSPRDIDEVSMDVMINDLDLTVLHRDIPIRTLEAAAMLVDGVLDEDPSSVRVGERVLPSAAYLSRMTGRKLSLGAERLLQAAAARVNLPFDVEEESRPIFHVFGTGVRNALCANGPVGIVERQSGLTLRVDVDATATEMLIEFDDGRGVVLPVLRDYFGVLKVNEGKIKEVYYEPSESSTANEERRDLQQLRSAVYSASAVGAFNLDRLQASKLARRLQRAKYRDPALAVYAAYAYHATGHIGTIREMREFLIERPRIRLFDVELLSRQPEWTSGYDLPPVVPSTPLLSQGWALIDALLPNFPRELVPLRKHVGNSLWSDYEPEGVRLLESWINRRAAEHAVYTTTGGIA